MNPELALLLLKTQGVFNIVNLNLDSSFIFNLNLHSFFLFNRDLDSIFLFNRDLGKIDK